MEINFNTSHAILLLAVPDERGVFRFPSNHDLGVGLLTPLVKGLDLFPQVIETAERFLSGYATKSEVMVYPDYKDRLQLRDDIDATLVLARSQPFTDPPQVGWPTLSQLLKNISVDKNRLAVMKAMQVFAGGLEETTRAVEARDLLKYLKDGETKI
jgi:hypothetical protein